jgi:phospholipid/cholesterol/gamma-HCH transport system substrate-binding protein
MARHSFAEVGAGAAVLALAGGFLVFALGNTGKNSTPSYQLYARFTDVGGLATGADVRMAGVKIGHVSDVHLDPKTFQAVVGFTVERNVKLSTDASAMIASSSLLGGASLAIQEGGADDNLKNGDTVTVTQSAVNVEDLLGKFIFNVGSLATATQKQLKIEQDRDQPSGAPKDDGAPKDGVGKSPP